MVELNETAQAQLQSMRRWFIFAGIIVASLATLSYFTVDADLAWWVRGQAWDTASTHPTTFESMSIWNDGLQQSHRDIASQLTRLGGSTWVFVTLPPLVIGLVIYRRGVLAAKFGSMLMTTIAAGILINLMKLLVGRLRPTRLIHEQQWGFEPLSIGYHYMSFPSGHSATIAGLCMIAYFVMPRLWPAWLSIGLIIGFTRIATNAHYLSDVLVGLYIGALIALIVRWAYARVGWWPARTDTGLFR